MKRIRYVKAAHGLSIDGLGRVRGTRMYPFYEPLERVGDVSATSLLRAADSYCADTGRDHLTLRVTRHTNAVFDPEITAPDLSRLEATGTLLRVVARESIFNPPTITVLEEVITSQVRPVLEQHEAQFIDLSLNIGRPTEPTKAEVSFTLPLRGRSIGEMFLIADAVCEAMGHAMRGARFEGDVFDALRSGRPAMLVGQAETSWMEVKQSPYCLDDQRQKLELAKDVAAFANASSGGLIVVGLQTRQVEGQDVIHRVRLFDLDEIDIHRYRQILNQYVFPPLVDIEIQAVSVHGRRGYLYIRVPTQPSEAKPVLVIGALVGDRVSGHYLTVPFRQDDVVQFRNPAALHSLLIAGRVALARADGALEE